MPLAKTSITLAAVLFLGAGCGGGGGTDAFKVRTGTYAASTATPMVVGLNWLVYFADEAAAGPGGTDLNGDGDAIDGVAVAVKINRSRETLLGVAAASAAAVNGEIYLAVVEAVDGRDWNGMNGLGDLVLLHWSERTQVVTFVDTLDPNIVNLAHVDVDRRLYYSAAATPAGDETTLRYLDSGQPTTPVVVENELGGGPLSPVLQGEDDGLIFLLIDETVEGGDRNGDGDATDRFVLALLDGTDPASRVKSVGLAQRNASSPFDAYPIQAGWQVGFLVNEAAQGNTNLNDQALFANPLLPASCAGTPDLDTADDVLHFLDYDGFLAGTSGPENTGLAGRDRVVVVEDHVATLSAEADANCDLNEDMDLLDVVPRWVGTALPIAPPVDPNELHAVAQTIPGGSLGIARLGRRYVIVVDEAADSRNLDGKVQDHQLVGWLDPADGPTASWTFAHQAPGRPAIGTGIFEDTDGDGVPDPGSGMSEPYAGTNWMQPEDVFGRLGVTFLEEVPGTNPRVASINNNYRCGILIKDTDLIDAVPVWADFESGPVLDWDGVGYALSNANPGVVVAGGFAYFNVGEAEDNFDYTGDGALDDVLLFRNPLTACNPIDMSVSSSLPGPAIVTDDNARGAAFFVSEAMEGMDLNGDGDTNDLIVRYFSL